MKVRYLVVMMLFIGTVAIPAGNIAAQEEDCDTSAFIDVSEGSAGEDYPDAELTVTCTETEMIISSNGIINFEFVPTTPGALEELEQTYTISLDPELSEETTDIPLLGTIAVAVNGLPIYGPNEGGNLGFGDPFLDGVLDYCNGHVGPTGYHFHARPDCLFDTVDGQVGLIIGYALDGFPILAPYVCTDADCTEIVEVTSSWQRTNDVVAAWEAHEYVEGSGDLDECNGLEDSDGNYAYYATNTFPYFLGCYHGVVPEELQNANQDQGGGEPPADGQGGQPPNDRGGRGNGNG